MAEDREERSIWQRIRAWFAGAPVPVASGSRLVAIRDEEGTAIVDEETLHTALSEAPDPAQGDLDALFARVRRLRVVDVDPDDGDGVRLDTGEPAALGALRDRLAIVEDPDTFGRCMCMGGPALELWDDSGVVAKITLHHGRSIRWDAWRWDATLRDGEALCRWLSERGVPEPLGEFVEADRLEAKATRDLERWRAAMPACLAPHEEAMLAFDVDLAPLATELVRALPGSVERIRALFAWFGRGAGPWSGFPSYESVPESLLLEYPTGELIEALRSGTNDGATLEGAARLFAGWPFSRSPKHDGGRLPDDLREALLAHSLASDDEDRKARARGAFVRRATPS